MLLRITAELCNLKLNSYFCREVCHHSEAYVRRSVLFAALCVLITLPPSFVASALVEGNAEISRGLEWVRTWAIQVVESDPDRECYTVKNEFLSWEHCRI